MSWRSLAIAVAVSIAACALAGCGFQPLYGGTTAGGQKLSDVMAGVEINPIPGRVGQKIRNELIFATTGGGYPAPSHYRLDITIKESLVNQLVEISGDATGQVYQLDATFRLMDPTGKVLLQGTAISRAPYNRFQEIFAENRAATTVADSIRTRIAAYLNTAA
jgi:LPS-assembly lipoprotein